METEDTIEFLLNYGTKFVIKSEHIVWELNRKIYFNGDNHPIF